MSILKYRAFLTTIEHNSLTKAAEVLGYTQPGISHMISSLERELGFPLLVRAKDGVFPTENARYLQYYMQQIISNNEALMETAYQIRGMERGSLKIGTFYSTSTRQPKGGSASPSTSTQRSLWLSTIRMRCPAPPRQTISTPSSDFRPMA